MPLPTPLTGNPFKITTFISGGRFGFSFNVYYMMPPAANVLIDGQRAVTAVSNAVMTGLTSSWSVDGARIAAVDLTGGTTYYAADMGITPGGTAGGLADSPQQAGVYVMQDLSGAVRRIWEMRGQPYVWNQSTVSRPFPPAPLAGQQNWMNSFGLMLATVGLFVAPAPSAPAGQCALRYRVKDPTLAPVTTVVQAFADPTSRFWWYNTPTNPGYMPGSRAIVFGMRARGIKGLNGPVKVINVTPAVAPMTGFVVQTTRPIYTVGVSTVTTTGSIKPLVYRYAAISVNLRFMRNLARKTGAAFFRTRGRASIRA